MTAPSTEARGIALPEWLQGKMAGKAAARYVDLVETGRAVASTGAPIVIGPWISEVGYELLYWIPMLRFLREVAPWSVDSAAVVSRGGASIWYEGLASRSCDALDVMPIDEYRAGNEQRWKAHHGSQKQKRVTDVDREVSKRSMARLGIGEHVGLHPKVMYKHLTHYWEGVLGLEWYDSLTRVAPLTVPSLGMRDRLPADYFAVKFYFRPSFPDTLENRRFIAALIRHLARIKPVVVIETGVRYDEHTEYEAEAGERVIRLDLSGRPSMNLALQTEIIARSSGFFGTYGGMTYLPMHFNVPTTCFVSDDEKVRLLHQTAAEHACARFRRQHGFTRSRLRVMDVAEARLMTGESAFSLA